VQCDCPIHGQHHQYDLGEWQKLVFYSPLLGGGGSSSIHPARYGLAIKHYDNNSSVTVEESTREIMRGSFANGSVTDIPADAVYFVALKV